MTTNQMTTPTVNPPTKEPPTAIATAASTPAPAKETTPTTSPRRPRRNRVAPVLRFSPVAWAKLLFFRDHGDTEIGGFGITPAEDPLYVHDFQTVLQETTMASVSFDDQAVSEFFERQVDAGRHPHQFCRIWCHSHPGNSPQPSSTDEETFDRVFGSCQHTLMFIVARGGKTYCRLRFNVGPGGDMLIPVDVDYRKPFVGADHAAWEQEFLGNIRPARSFSVFGSLGCGDWPEEQKRPSALPQQPGKVCMAQDVLEQLEAMDPAERQQVLDELADRPELWSDEEVDVYG